MSNRITYEFKKELIAQNLYDLEKKISNEVLLEEVRKYNETKVISKTLHQLIYLLIDNMMRIFHINQELNFSDVITDCYIKVIESIPKFNINRELKDDTLTKNNKKAKDVKPNAFAFFSSITRNHVYTLCNKFTKNRINKDMLYFVNGEYYMKDIEEKEFEDYIKLTKKLRSKKK
jgi:hypothetical protein